MSERQIPPRPDTCPRCGATTKVQMYLDNFCGARVCGGHPCPDEWHTEESG